MEWYVDTLTYNLHNYLWYFIQLIIVNILLSWTNSCILNYSENNIVNHNNHLISKNMQYIFIYNFLWIEDYTSDMVPIVISILNLFVCSLIRVDVRPLVWKENGFHNHRSNQHSSLVVTIYNSIRIQLLLMSP